LLGTLKRSDFEEDRINFDVSYSDIIVHEGWNKTGQIENDIALIRFKIPLHLPKKSQGKMTDYNAILHSLSAVAPSSRLYQNYSPAKKKSSQSISHWNLSNSERMG
jgi:hypothetical protein